MPRRGVNFRGRWCGTITQQAVEDANGAWVEITREQAAELFWLDLMLVFNPATSTSPTVNASATLGTSPAIAATADTEDFGEEDDGEETVYRYQPGHDINVLVGGRGPVLVWWEDEVPDHVLLAYRHGADEEDAEEGDYVAREYIKAMPHGPTVSLVNIAVSMKAGSAQYYASLLRGTGVGLQDSNSVSSPYEGPLGDYTYNGSVFLHWSTTDPTEDIPADVPSAGWWGYTTFEDFWYDEEGVPHSFEPPQYSESLGGVHGATKYSTATKIDDAVTLECHAGDIAFPIWVYAQATETCGWEGGPGEDWPESVDEFTGALPSVGAVVLSATLGMRLKPVMHLTWGGIYDTDTGAPL